MPAPGRRGLTVSACLGLWSADLSAGIKLSFTENMSAEQISRCFISNKNSTENQQFEIFYEVLVFSITVYLSNRRIIKKCQA